MSKYIINGGKELYGDIDIKAGKNSVLPLLSASIMTDEEVILHNCPKISDVDNMLVILGHLGAKYRWDGDTLIIDPSNVNNGEIPSELARALRSSIFLLGSVLTRMRSAKVSYPGGCDIGLRPIDIHLKGMRELNIDVKEEGGYIYCNSRGMTPRDIILDLPSVGATENLIMASVLTRGRTIIRNVAKEPEILDLQRMLNLMGAKVFGAGGSVIVVDGVKKLHGVEYTPIPDRIVVGTYMIATAMCGGEVTLNNAIYEHIYSLASKISKSTCNITPFNDRIIIKSRGRHRALDKIDTMYYPGFPTDMQSQAMALATVCRGTSIITENIFETRFRTVSEFRKMGAEIVVRDRTAIINGVKALTPATVKAEDLRGGASLVLMALKADGVSTVTDIEHIERGYEDMDKVLNSLGAMVKHSDD